jgi:hypothetical protein
MDLIRRDDSGQSAAIALRLVGHVSDLTGGHPRISVLAQDSCDLEMQSRVSWEAERDLREEAELARTCDSLVLHL